MALASVVLAAIAAYLVFRAGEPREPVVEAVSEPTAPAPDRVEVWLSSPDAAVQFLLKPSQDSAPRAEFHDRALLRRLRIPDDAYRFFVLAAVNFSAEEPIVLHPGSLRVHAVDRNGVRATSAQPAELLARSEGEVPSGDLFVAAALGIRRGESVVAPGRIAKFLVAFDRTSDPEAWVSVILEDENLRVDLARASVLHRHVEEFLLRPSGPILPLPPGGEPPTGADAPSQGAAGRPH